MAALVESINKNVQSSTANTNVATFPLPMITLDSLTVHAKMSLIHRWGVVGVQFIGQIFFI